MAKKATFGWQKAPVSTLKLQLDALNPRIDVPNSAGQEQIRVALIESEKVVDLAKAIVRTNGVMAGERIIVTTENNRFVVLEGNRRVCACQILIKPELAPADYRDSFPAPTQALKDTISDLDTDIAPSRDAAEPIITRRHTEPGIESWTPIANQRRLLRLLASAKTLKEICDATGMTPARAQRLLQDARLIEHMLSLGCWSKDEQRRLRSPDLKPNAFIRFFSLKSVKDTLKMLFDPADGRPTSGLLSKDFDRSVELLARQFLIPSDGNGKPEADTRSVPEDVFAKLASKDKALANGLPPDARQVISRVGRG